MCYLTIFFIRAQFLLFIIIIFVRFILFLSCVIFLVGLGSFY